MLGQVNSGYVMLCQITSCFEKLAQVKPC